MRRETGEALWSSPVGEGGAQGEASIGGGRIFAFSNNCYRRESPSVVIFTRGSRDLCIDTFCVSILMRWL